MFWIADAVLVIIAWKRGWGRLSFLPVIVGLMAAGLLASICGITGKSNEMILFCMLLIEISVAFSLLGLCILGSNENTSTN